MNRTCKELIPFDDFVPFKDYPLKKDLNNNEIDKLYKQVINDLNLPKKYIDNLKEKRILKEALNLYNNILINGTTKDGINYTYIVTKKDISSEVLSKLKELVELDESSISVKYVSINFVPSYTFNINVPVVEITNDNVKTLHE